MFLWNLEKCLHIFSEVYVSSDSDEVLDITEEVGGIGIKRPKELCGDTPNIPVYRHAVKYMSYPDAIVAVQANSPTIKIEAIKEAKNYIENGDKEVKTCYEGFQDYGSVWAMTINKLNNYPNPYVSEPCVWIKDDSIDIHNEEDLYKALCQLQ